MDETIFYMWLIAMHVLMSIFYFQYPLYEINSTTLQVQGVVDENDNINTNIQLYYSGVTINTYPVADPFNGTSQVIDPAVVHDTQGLLNVHCSFLAIMIVLLLGLSYYFADTSRRSTKMFVVSGIVVVSLILVRVMLILNVPRSLSNDFQHFQHCHRPIDHQFINYCSSLYGSNNIDKDANRGQLVIYHDTKVVIIVVILLTIQSLCVVKVSSQEVPQAEYDSLVWLIRQMGIHGQNPINVCSSGIMCTSVDGAFHVVSIKKSLTFFPFFQTNKQRNLVSTTFTDVGQPSPFITSLTFPYITSLSLTFDANTPRPYYTDISTLSLLGGSFPLLRSLTIRNDATIKSIPSTFGSNLVSLNTLSILNAPNLVEVSSFGASPAKTFLLGQSDYLQRINWDLVQKQEYSITILQLEMVSSTIETFELTMPLGILAIANERGHMITLSVKSFVPSVTIEGNIIARFGHPSNITYLSLKTTSSIIPSDFAAYPSLITYEQSNVKDTLTFPFTDYSLTPNLQSISMSRNNLIAFPKIPILPSLKSIIFSSNNFTGVLPLEPFLTAATGLGIDLTNNLELTGSLTPNFCSFNTYIANTGITQVPDCFYCYYGANRGFSSSIPPPAGFHCDIKFDKEVFPSIGGVALIYGNNLGWSSGSSYTMLIPNTKISYPFAAITAPQTVGFNFSDRYYLETKVVVADIKLSSVSVDAGAVGLSLDKGLRYPCSIYFSDSANIRCQLYQVPPSNYTLVISNPYLKTYTNIQSIKGSTIISYPLVSSAQLSGATLQSLTLNGNFGNNTFNTPSVTLNNTIPCNITSKNQNTIVCTLLSTPQPGQASVQTHVDGFSTTANNLIMVPFPPSIDLKQKCIEDTLNCYGHGQCSDQGICLCDQNYYDNCKYFKNPNVTFVQNDTKPVATFELDGYKFFFSLVAIQELDVDDNVVQELIVDQWNVTDQSGDDLTSLHYRLLINSTLYPTLSSIVNVTSLIEYSTKDRQLPFGDSIVSVGANSIKVGVNVTGWQYQSILSHLRVVFSTIVNNEQSTIESCSSSDIPTFEQILGSDSYLRVIKNDTQFYGRFLSYSYSDGRKTFSRNELINQTKIIGNNNNESLALIGVHVPQCTFCLLDPDFSALVVNKEQSDCSSPSSSNTWKIIVGCVVGGAVFIALVIALAFYIRDSNSVRFKLKAAKSILMKKVNKDVNHYNSIPKQIQCTSSWTSKTIICKKPGSTED
ncbi:hypothetical protein DFA_09643 [Cavenderia fasciculata]|uniref:ComC supersandwich domain-containing protein n=1 Tax=Cavenderia fasciculata TaxID=261658 RepID=F4Q872_CACFS|nr:uncharacterized protein DFA_09643 [Cavenderia fasciculata]EGG15972.1 hypothetical protein DFA_09643 [Cavenderia fasciculata]|eukprot:XP_004352297.1 hypothetical protein DFA_09643 [Cavenderia fasciculata]